MAAAGDTVPASFGAQPLNLASDRSHITTEMCSIWTMFFAPTLLCCQFQKPWFYKHFLHLVHLLKLCMEFELTQEQIDELKEGFKSWVKDYEWYVESPVFSSYQLTPLQLLLPTWPPLHCGMSHHDPCTTPHSPQHLSCWTCLGVLDISNGTLLWWTITKYQEPPLSIQESRSLCHCPGTINTDQTII